VDTTDLTRAFDDFLHEAVAGGFTTSPDRVLANVLAVTAHVASTALAIQAGLRVAYDNRPTNDVANLRRLTTGRDLVARVRAGGEVLRTVAAQLTDDDLAVSLPIMVVEGDEVVVDQPLPLLWLVARVAEQHLPKNTQRLRDLRL
jgi:hypothetical protein